MGAAVNAEAAPDEIQPPGAGGDRRTVQTEARGVTCEQPRLERTPSPPTTPSGGAAEFRQPILGRNIGWIEKQQRRRDEHVSRHRSRAALGGRPSHARSTFADIRSDALEKVGHGFTAPAILGWQRSPVSPEAKRFNLGRREKLRPQHGKKTTRT